MAHVAPIYPTFARGEVSPLMFGRIDIEQYPSCLDKCRNVYIRPYGCASRISGTEFVANAKNNGKARLLKFVFSANDSYIIECGAGYFRFYHDGAPVIITNASAWVTGTAYKKGDFVKYSDVTYYCVYAHTASVFADDVERGYWIQQDVYEVPNDYYSDQLQSIQYVQLDDIIKLTCLPHNNDNTTARPKELIRNSSSNWTFRNVTFKETPYLDQNTSSITMTPSAATGTGITITASSSYFNSSMVGANMWIGTKVTNSSTNKDVQGYVKITGYTNSTTVTATVMSKLSGTSATTLWGEGAFSDYRGYPAVVALYDGRLYYARTPYQPRNIYGSKPYSYETFTPAVDNEDDAGINVELATNANGDGSDIKWMIGASYLLCGTYGGEFVIRGSGEGAITPTDISARQRTNWGGEPVQPIVAGTFVHFLQRNGNKLRQFQYDYYYDAYKAVDVSIFSEHLLESPIKQMALQKNPDSIIYLMREDGKVVMLTLEQDQSVQAWSLLEENGANVESIQTIPSNDGNYDEVYMLMLREGLSTSLSISSSNPNLTFANRYYGVEQQVGVIEKTLTCQANKYHISRKNDAKLTNGILSNFKGTSVSYAILLAPSTSSSYYFKPANNTWEMVFGFKTGNASSLSSVQYITSTTLVSASANLMITSNKHFRFLLSTDGTTSNLIGTAAQQTGSYTVQANTNYLVKLKFSGSAYTLQYSTNNGASWTTDITISTTKKVVNNKSYIVGCDWENSTYRFPFAGTIDLNKCYIKINNRFDWTGADTYWVDSNGKTAVLTKYGFGVTGLAEKGDKIYLTYTTTAEAPVRYIERIKSPITSNNRHEWWYVRSGLEYNAYSMTSGKTLMFSDSTGNITVTSSSSIFAAGNVGRYLRTIDKNGNILGEGLITAYNSGTSIEVSVIKEFENSIAQGGYWGISVTSISGLTHLEAKLVQVFADGYAQNEKRVESGSITLDKPSYRIVVGLPYTSYITTMPMEAGSQNGTAVGKRKRISEMAIRVWNSIGVKVGRDLNNLYETIYQQTEPYTGVIPNIKYNQGWVWDANITVEQSRPYPMNILSIAPLVTEVDK